MKDEAGGAVTSDAPSANDLLLSSALPDMTSAPAGLPP